MQSPGYIGAPRERGWDVGLPIYLVKFHNGAWLLCWITDLFCENPLIHIKVIAKEKPLAVITSEAIRMLSQEMGIVDTVRFLNQFTTGYGNYVEEREDLFGHLTLDEIIAEIKANQPDSRN